MAMAQMSTGAARSDDVVCPAAAAHEGTLEELLIPRQHHTLITQRSTSPVEISTNGS